MQVERVRFTLQPFSVEEIAKLWTGFQTQYRFSVAYEAAVVLIESARAAVTPLPVLMRGPGDSGVIAQANMLPPFPEIDVIEIPGDQPAAKLGDVLTFNGHNLSGDQVNFRFTSRRLAAPIVVAPKSVSDTSLTVQVPADAPADWPAGMYTVTALISAKNQPDRETNEMPLQLAPQITSKLPIQAKQTANGDVSLKINCAPEVRPEQRVSLLLAGQEIPAAPHAAQTKQLTFVIPAATAGEYLVRLRVDGVDSQLIDRSKTPPVFDSKQKVVIT
jgi:hypothetical protein